MRYTSPLRPGIALLLLAALPALGQNTTSDSAAASRLESPQADSLNRFGLAWRLSFNIQVGFKNVGAFAARTDPGAATGANSDRTYDDGFNRVDVTGNNHGAGYANTTWYWGYDSESQILPSVSNPQSIAMHSSSATGSAASGRDESPDSGVEFSYNRELFRRGHWRFGLEAVFGYTELTMDDNSPASTDVTQITDTYSIPSSSTGQFLPPPGRNATPQGPGSVISSDPTRTTSTIQGQVGGSRSFRADLFGFRFGPYLEFPIGKKAAFDLSGGFALMSINSDFAFNESTTISGLSSFNSSGSSSHSDLLYGGYVAGSFSYAVSTHWAAFAGAQFQNLGRYTQTAGNREVVLDLSRSIFVTLGVSYSW